MAKKTTSTEKSSDKPKAAAKKKAATKTESKSVEAGFDSSQVALSAAALLAARAKNALPSAGAKKPESAGFKQLKESLGQPQISHNSPIAGLTGLTKTTNNTGFSQQVGHSQTVGKHAANTGVPRRTSNG